MKSKTAASTHPIRTAGVAVALAAVLCTPAIAFAATTQSASAEQPAATQTATTAEYTDYENMSNQEYVDTLVGLSDSEKQELVALYDKYDALAENEDLSDAEWTRMCELEDKAWYTETEQWINSDESLTSEQRATYLQQLNQMKELDSWFDAYYSDATYLEKCDQYDAISDSLGSYLGWDEAAEYAYEYSDFA